MNNDLIYLASPYSGTPEQQEQRFNQVCRVAAALMLRGWHVYSPIAHSHWIARLGNLPMGWEFWRGPSLAMVAVCSKLVVVTMDGWRKSVGVRAEIEMAQQLDKPVGLMQPSNATRPDPMEWVYWQQDIEQRQPPQEKSR